MLLVLLTVLAGAAGAAAGMLVARIPGSSAGSASNTAAAAASPMDRTPLVEELQLTPEQRDQMRSIWEGVRDQVHHCFDDARQLQSERDDALVALLNDEQKAQFERISKDYANRYAELVRKRDQTFQDAVERTRKLLNDEQRRKYEQLLKTRVGPGLTPPPMHPPPDPSSPPEKPH
jgi:Spy/CpxP family protein refolding chaperone